jgi:hypothetical protein
LKWHRHLGRACGQRETVSAILAGLEQRFDLIVIPQERDEQVRWPVLKDEAQRSAAATLENLIAQLANPQATVHMRAAKGLRQLAQRQQALGSFVLRKVS